MLRERDLCSEISIESYDILEASISKRGDKVDGTVIDIKCKVIVLMRSE